MSKQAKTSTQVLKAVAWIIDHVGWTQHVNFRAKNGKMMGGGCLATYLTPKQYSKLGSVCLHGAVHLVSASSELKEKAIARLDSMCYHNNSCSSSMGFNDEDDTTKEQVLSLIQRVINKGQKS